MKMYKKPATAEYDILPAGTLLQLSEGQNTSSKPGPVIGDAPERRRILPAKK